MKFRFWGGNESEDSEGERFAGLQIQRGTSGNRSESEERITSSQNFSVPVGHLQPSGHRILQEGMIHQNGWNLR